MGDSAGSLYAVLFGQNIITFMIWSQRCLKGRGYGVDNGLFQASMGLLNHSAPNTSLSDYLVVIASVKARSGKLN
jgi:hypothetical protein